MSKVDFVITWVDGNSPEWLEQFNKYAPAKKNVITEDYINKRRYEDIGLLRYWFRCVEKNAPWVNKVFFITNGQKPDWLNLDCKKLVWIKHEDYIPKEHLPTFNPYSIEIHLHRIKDLSNCFVLFNDDMFILNRVKKSYYFNDNGLPCDFAILDAVPAEFFGHVIINCLSEINSRFDKNKVISQNKNKWFNLIYGKTLLRTLYYNRCSVFTGFVNKHASQAFLKHTFEDVWENCERVLFETSLSKFRNVTDVMQYLFRYWQLVTGKFNPVSPKGRRYFGNDIDVKELAKCFFDPKIKEICINDGNIRTEVIELFEKHYHIRSQFELTD